MPLSDQGSTGTEEVELEPGIYLLEAESLTAKASSWLIVQGTGVIKKRIANSNEVIWVVDASSGRPLPDLPLEVLEVQGDKQSFSIRRTQRMTDSDGCFKFKTREAMNRIVTTQRCDEFVCCSIGDAYSWNALAENVIPIEWKENRRYVITDRPAYRQATR